MNDAAGAIRAAPLDPPSARARNLVFGVIAATIALGWLGDALWGSLVDTHPLTLILLNAKPRYLVLTVGDLDPWVYYPVATLRLLGTKPLVWLVGAWYGDRAVGWAERRSARGGAVIRWVEEHFGRFGWAIIAITSNNVVCLLAGSTGFSLTWFMVLAVVGTVVRLWIFAVVGDVFSGSIDEIIAFVGDHRLAVVVLSVVVLVGGLWWQHRRGGSAIDSLRDLERATDDQAGTTGPGRGPDRR